MINNLYETFKKAQNGSEEHVIELYNKFLPLIKGYGIKLNYEEAESDLTIFLLEYIKKFDLNKLKNRSDGEIVNYIKIIFKNKYIDVLRQLMNKKIEITLLETEFISNDCYKKLEEEYIFSLIKNLSDIQRKIIVGRYFHGYSDDNLSKFFKISRQAVYKHRKKALELMKLEINKNIN
nr:sigma-70 family RNA polymerase sigma factor [Sedimentibacter sp.]